MLKGKKILVGITGGIAAYKAAELVRQLCKCDAEVNVVMTRNAQQFVTPLTFQTISSRPVHTDLFSSFQPEISHIALADNADLIIIAPATANIIAKCATGIADDLLSSVVLSTAAQVLIAPAMNTKMWENPVTQHNVAQLKERGFTFVGPATGELACGYDGKGRLVELDNILEEAIALLSKKDLQGERILITAGPTHEPVDPIRLLTNRSSGKMGYALARASHNRGAEVLLVTGPTTLNPPSPDYVMVLKEDIVELAQDTMASQQLDAVLSPEEVVARASHFAWRYLHRAERNRVEKWVNDKEYKQPKIILET